MFRLFTSAGLTALILAITATAQPPMTAPPTPAPMTPPPTPASDTKLVPATPALVVVATVEVEGKQLGRMVPDPTDGTKTKLIKEVDPFHTFKLTVPVVLAEPVTAIKKSVLVMPTLVKGQLLPKQIEGLTPPDPDNKNERRLLVKELVVETVTLEEDETVVLLTGTKLPAGTVIRANVAKFKVIAPEVPDVRIKLATGGIVPADHPLHPKVATLEVGQLTADRDELKAKVKALEKALAEQPVPTITPLSVQKDFVDLKKDVEDLKKGHEALKKTVEDLKKDLVAREKEVNDKLDEALKAATNKADKDQLKTVNDLLAELGDLKTAKARLDRIPGIEADVAKLKTPPAAPTSPTVTSPVTIQRCIVGGTVPSVIVENGCRYRYSGHVGGNCYLYTRE